MPPISVADSFIDDERTASYYDLVIPFCKMEADGNPCYLVGTCFPIGIGIYLTAAHCFAGFEEARGRYKRLTAEKMAPTLEEKAERLHWMKEERFLEGADVNCGALILDQAAIRQGQLKPLGFSLFTAVVMSLDFDLAVLFVKHDKRRNPAGEVSPIPCFSLIEKPHLGQKIAVAGSLASTISLSVAPRSRSGVLSASQASGRCTVTSSRSNVANTAGSPPDTIKTMSLASAAMQASVKLRISLHRSGGTMPPRRSKSRSQRSAPLSIRTRH
jgi:hypothetical protein